MIIFLFGGVYMNLKFIIPNTKLKPNKELLLYRDIPKNLKVIDLIVLLLTIKLLN